MHDDPFEPLARALNRLPQLSSHWFSILKNWITRCEGFLDDAYFYTSDPTATHLIQQTVLLLESLPATVTDDQLSQRLADDFEGLFLSAHSHGHHWDSTKMPYTAFRQQSWGIPDNLIDTVAHCPSANGYSWLIQQLPDHA